jgi:pyrroline-5-carboxylate reductase
MSKELILRAAAAGQQGENLRIRKGKELLEGSLLIVAGLRVGLLEEALQQNVQLAHAAPATPAQAGQVLALVHPR